MIRIIFGNGDIINCDNIARVYIEEFEMEKVTVVGKMEEENDERLPGMGSRTTRTQIRLEV